MNVPEIVVVGAGPTGLTVACELARQGVPCRVVDQAAEPSSSSRAIAVFPRTLEILDGIGAAQPLIDCARPMQVANFYSRGSRIGRVSMTGLSGTRFPFSLAVPQAQTERVLEERLQRLGGTVERGVTLSGLKQRAGGSVALTLEGASGEEQVEADWVIGADGAHSAVRKLSQIAFDGKATNDAFVIVDAFCDGGPVSGEGHWFFSPDGLLVVVALPDGSYRLAATIAPGSEGSALELDFVQGLVDRRIPGGAVRLRSLRSAGWGVARVHVHTRIASAFRAGRCLLAGDAAHIYSPVGGQGMNGGIQDAHNLAWKLALACRSAGSDTLLDSYDAERRPLAHEILRATSAQTRLGTLRSPVTRALRDRLLARATKSGALDRRMAPQLSQLGVRYTSGGAVVPNGKKGPQGTRLPDAPLDAPGNAQRTTFALLGERRFTILALSPSQSELDALRELEAHLRREYDDLVAVCPIWRTAGKAPPNELVDGEGQLHDRLGAKGASLCLVRPDAHVAYAGSIADHAPLRAFLATVLTASQPARAGV